MLKDSKNQENLVDADQAETVDQSIDLSTEDLELVDEFFNEDLDGSELIKLVA